MDDTLECVEDARECDVSDEKSLRLDGLLDDPLDEVVEEALVAPPDS